MRLFAETETDETTETPDWFSELMNRIMQVIAKLLAKLGIKMGM